MFIEEFAAVVGIEAADSKGQRLFDVFGLTKDPELALTPDGALFGPAGGDIRIIDGDGVLSVRRFAAVMDRVCFDKTGTKFVPLVGFDRDLMSQERAWLGQGSSVATIASPDRRKQSINGAGRYELQLGADMIRQGGEFLLVGSNPEGQDCFEPGSAGQMSRKPDTFERDYKLRMGVAGWFAGFFPFGFGKAFESFEGADSVFAVITAGGTKLVKHSALLFS